MNGKLLENKNQPLGTETRARIILAIHAKIRLKKAFINLLILKKEEVKKLSQKSGEKTSC